MLSIQRLFFLVSLCAVQYALCSFTLLTTLYNEKNQERVQEYITCLERNVAHEDISELHVLYDTSKDDEHGSVILDALRCCVVRLTFIEGRPSYAQLFDYANKNLPNQKVIVTNADIYFNDTLFLLDDFDFTNTVLALTRWDVHADGSLHLLMNKFGKPNMFSQDSWIFTTPLPTLDCSKIKIGILYCDSQLAHKLFSAGLRVFNPCYSIQCCHMHLSDIRSEDRQESAPGLASKLVEWVNLQDIPL